MPSEDIVTIDVDLDDVFDYDDLTSVGRVYQCGINGVGYMLADTPEQPAYRKQLIPLDPERLATSDTPFSQAIERYNFGTLADGTAGAGQKWLNRDSSTSTAFYSSEGVDPFTTPGEITLLNTASTEEVDDTYSGLLLTVVGRSLYVLTDTKDLTRVDAPGGSAASEIEINSGAGTVTSLTSDGQYWYAADGANIYRGTTSGGVSAWSAQDASKVLWAGGRICAAVISSGSTPNRFTTLNDSGAEERSSGHITFPVGSTIHLGGETAGHVYFGAENGNVGSVWAWPMGLNDSGNHHYPFEALELPSGMVPTAVGVGGGFVWVRAHRPEGTSKGQTVIYQCVPDQNGSLIANFVAELAPVGTTADHSVGDFASNGDFMYFSWKTMSNSKAGVGAVYLPTGGYAEWYEAGADGDVASIDVWQGLPVMAVRGQGVYRVDTAAYVTTSNIVTSVIDGASSLDKIWDDVTVVHDPLPSGGSVQVHYSLDKGGSWVDLGSSASAGTKNKTFSINKVGKTLMLKATIALSSGSTAPKLSIMQARFHPIGLKDELIQLTIDCGDQLKGLNGHPLPENGYGAGAKRANTLESLVQQRVKFQDIDWHIQGSSLVYDCESVDIGATILYDPQTSGQKIRLLATLTLRKAS
jgi:hypothetical protein